MLHAVAWNNAWISSYFKGKTGEGGRKPSKNENTD